MRLSALPLGVFFLSCFSTLAVWPLTLPARAREPCTLPAQAELTWLALCQGPVGLLGAGQSYTTLLQSGLVIGWASGPAGSKVPSWQALQQL